MTRIASIEPIFLRYRFPPAVRYEYSGGVVESMEVALIRIRAEDGSYGLGEVTHGAFCYEPVVGLVQHFERLLRGHPVRQINRAWELMYQSSLFWNRQGIGIGVMGGIDMALHDLSGKLLGVPVHQLLGGPVRDSIRLYASNGLFAEPAPLLADIARAKARGFTAYKLRVTDPARIVGQLRAARDAYGDSLDFIVDAVQGSNAVPWAVSVSQRMADALEPYNILWFEEPCRVEDIDGYAHLKRTTRVNIAGAESIPTALAFKPYLERDCFDLVQFDIATSGLSEGRRIAELAALWRKPVAIHSWGSLVSIMAGVHLALVTPNCAITEYCFMDHPLNERLAATPFALSDGRLPAPEAPGLGVRLDDDLPAAFPYLPQVNTMISTAERDILLASPQSP
jgi:L-alanine-DL-glutamate epimerase-like enolase superfamily enzyme